MTTVIDSDNFLRRKADEKWSETPYNDNEASLKARDEFLASLDRYIHNQVVMTNKHPTDVATDVIFCLMASIIERHTPEFAVGICLKTCRDALSSFGIDLNDHKSTIVVKA